MKLFSRSAKEQSEIISCPALVNFVSCKTNGEPDGWLIIFASPFTTFGNHTDWNNFLTSWKELRKFVGYRIRKPKGQKKYAFIKISQRIPV
jgi:hypothetical protein